MTMALPEFLQTKTYAAMRLRQVFLDMNLREGIAEFGAVKTTQRAAGGANLSVDVAAGPAFVKGDLTSRQGLYHVYNDAVVNLAIGTNTSGNPRIDQVVARVYDSQDGLAGSDEATLEILPGSPQAGATLDNRNGAATLPGTAMRVCDILVPASAASITNSNIRDRRPFAKPMVIDVSGVSTFDFPVDSVSDSHFTIEHVNVETVGYSNINFYMNGLSTTIYSTAFTEQVLLTTGLPVPNARGGYNGTTGLLNLVGNPTVAGGFRYNGFYRQNLLAMNGARLGAGNCSASSITASGNHVLSAFTMAEYVTSSAVWHTLTVWSANGNFSGRFIYDKIPLVA